MQPLLYDGNPAYPDPGVLWEMAQNAAVTMFGASPAYVRHAVEGRRGTRGEVRPVRAATPSCWPDRRCRPECSAWFYRNVKPDLWLHSGSGGTDVCSGFAGGAPVLPVYAGEIQARNLGVAAYAFDDQGEAVTGQVGEMVITQPMPSMPVRLWNDDDGELYRRDLLRRLPRRVAAGRFLQGQRARRLLRARPQRTPP